MSLRLYKRTVGESSWTLAATYERPDLPVALQLGPILYAPSGSPDLRVTVDEVLFAAAARVSDCESD